MQPVAKLLVRFSARYKFHCLRHSDFNFRRVNKINSQLSGKGKTEGKSESQRIKLSEKKYFNGISLQLYCRDFEFSRWGFLLLRYFVSRRNNRNVADSTSNSGFKNGLKRTIEKNTSAYFVDKHKSFRAIELFFVYLIVSVALQFQLTAICGFFFLSLSQSI